MPLPDLAKLAIYSLVGNPESSRILLIFPSRWDALQARNELCADFMQVADDRDGMWVLPLGLALVEFAFFKSETRSIGGRFPPAVSVYGTVLKIGKVPESLFLDELEKRMLDRGVQVISC